MGNSTIPAGQKRLNLNLDADVCDALAAEARINVRKTGPHVAKVLDDYIARKIANAERRQRKISSPIAPEP